MANLEPTYEVYNSTLEKTRALRRGVKGVLDIHQMPKGFRKLLVEIVIDLDDIIKDLEKT